MKLKYAEDIVWDDLPKIEDPFFAGSSVSHELCKPLSILTGGFASDKNPLDQIRRYGRQQIDPDRLRQFYKEIAEGKILFVHTFKDNVTNPPFIWKDDENLPNKGHYQLNKYISGFYSDQLESILLRTKKKFSPGAIVPRKEASTETLHRPIGSGSKAATSGVHKKNSSSVKPSAQNSFPNIPKTPSDAPKQITFSSKINKQMDGLWGKSFPKGKSQEFGGTLVRHKSGDTELINTVGGNKGTFSPDRTTNKNQKLLGVFHTHPYDKREGGYTNVSLSGGDAGYMINKGDAMIMAQSGKGQYLYLRTDQTPKSVNYNQLSTDQNTRMSELIRKNNKSFSEASQIAAAETAKKYNLAYYEGQNGVLSRVQP